MASILVPYHVFLHRTCFLSSPVIAFQRPRIRIIQRIHSSAAFNPRDRYYYYAYYAYYSSSSSSKRRHCYRTLLSSVFSLSSIHYFTLLSFLHERRHYGQQKKYRYEYDCRICVQQLEYWEEIFLIRGAGMHGERWFDRRLRIGWHDFLYKGRQAYQTNSKFCCIMDALCAE